MSTDSLLLDYASLDVAQTCTTGEQILVVDSAVRDAGRVNDLNLTGREELQLPLGLRHLIWEINSGPFIEMIEMSLGLSALVPDPQLRDGGYVTVGGNLQTLTPQSTLPGANLYLQASVVLNLDSLNALLTNAIEIPPGGAAIMRATAPLELRTPDAAAVALVAHFYSRSANAEKEAI